MIVLSATQSGVSSLLVAIGGALLGALLVLSAYVFRELRRTLDFRRSVLRTPVTASLTGAVHDDLKAPEPATVTVPSFQPWPQQQGLTLELVRDVLRAAGVEEHQEVENWILFGVASDGVDIHIAVAIDETWRGLQLRSYAYDLEADQFDLALAERALSLNSENKIGSIGVEKVSGEDKYRFWVDHYLNLDGRAPTVPMLAQTLGAIVSVQREIGQALPVTQ